MAVGGRTGGADSKAEIIRSAEVFTFLTLPGQTPEEATAKARRDVSKLVGHEVGLEEFVRGGFRGYPPNFVGTPQQAIELYNTLIEAGDRIDVRKSPRAFKLLKPAGGSFYEALRQKLRWQGL